MSSNVFGDLSDDDDDKNQNNMISQAEKNIMEDPSLYSYDDFYEENHQKRTEIKQEKKKNIEQPKYLSDIISATEKRKREQGIIYEKLQEKKILKDQNEFGNKEKFVTETYKKMLEENKKFQKEDDQKEAFNKLHTVENKTNMNDFYKNMFENNAFRGGQRELSQQGQKKIDINQKQIQQNQKQQQQNDNENNVIEEKNQEKQQQENQKQIESQKQQKAKNKNSRSKSRSRSKSKEKKNAKNQQIEKNKSKEKQDQPQQQSQISTKDKLLGAKERYLQRKQQQQLEQNQSADQQANQKKL